MKAGFLGGNTNSLRGCSYIFLWLDPGEPCGGDAYLASIVRFGSASATAELGPSFNRNSLPFS